MPRRRARCIGFALILALGAPAVARAAMDERPGEAPDRTEGVMKQYHLHPAFTKLGRGVGNFFGGWLEIPIQVEDHYVSTDPIPTFATGVAVGVFKGVVRTGVGVYEAVTFLIPFPEHYDPVLPPLAFFQKRRNW